MATFKDPEIREIEPLTLFDFIKLDSVLEYEIRAHLSRATYLEAYASECAYDERIAELKRFEAQRQRERASDLASVLLLLRQHYLNHPEDPHDLL